MENVFIKGIKSKVRFNSNKGLISIEDLYDLPLTQLDKIAIALKKEIDDVATGSFIKPAPSNASLKMKFEIAKYVIEDRLAEAEAAKQLKDRKEQKEKILRIMADKQDEDLKGKSLDDLTEMLKNL